ncbi:HEAT repeat domain-containing protein [Metallumcola ferriviriculae]|uniref:HEAT repeat domain-containing protein n=1 Tax=Metallumcola ferriviriculae TaxID=3039180 RepID=A0AAU0UK96_9FIRM|nr:HEAT repeat domain-containing protein [Desulfitibacteraceae bacterium MK1]
MKLTLILPLISVVALYLFIRHRKGLKKAKISLNELEPKEAALLLLHSDSEEQVVLAQQFEAIFNRPEWGRWQKKVATADPDTQADFAMAAAKFGGDPGQEWLMWAWQQSNPGLQLAVSRALAETVNQTTLTQILPLLHSAKAGLPTRAAEVVLSMGEKAVQPLLSHLKEVQKAVEKKFVIQLLGESESVRAVPDLTKCLLHDHEDVRREAVIALGKLAEKAEVSEALVKTLDDESWQVRAQAARVAGLMGIVEAAPALEALSVDPRWEVSTHAKEALSMLGGAKDGL